MKRNIKGELTYLGGLLHKSLWDNVESTKGVTYHFTYEHWAKNDKFWTIHKFVNNRLDEDGLDYYGLKKGIERYSRKSDCQTIFIYRYSRKERRFVTNKVYEIKKQTI